MQDLKTCIGTQQWVHKTLSRVIVDKKDLLRWLRKTFDVILFLSLSLSSETSTQYLIFLVWHLIISSNIETKIISTCLHNNLNMKCHFTENPSYATYPEAVLIIQMLVSPKVFVPQKRYCTFWKWQNLSFNVCIGWKQKILQSKTYRFFFSNSTF